MNFASRVAAMTLAALMCLMVAASAQQGPPPGGPPPQRGPDPNYYQPDELVGPLLLLCSQAGDWITGQTLHVDGGWVLRP